MYFYVTNAQMDGIFKLQRVFDTEIPQVLGEYLSLLLNKTKYKTKELKTYNANIKVMVVSAFILCHEQELNNSVRSDQLTSRL